MSKYPQSVCPLYVPTVEWSTRSINIGNSRLNNCPGIFLQYTLDYMPFVILCKLLAEVAFCEKSMTILNVLPDISV